MPKSSNKASKSARKLARPQKKVTQQRAPQIVVIPAPVAKSARIVTGPRIFRSVKDGVVIAHREYMNSISAGSTAFTGVSYYPLNPGDHTVFPWLSSLARNFACFRFRRVTVSYVSESATTAAGTVMLAYSADGGDINNPPQSKTEMLEYGDAVRCSPWDNAKFNCKVSGEKRHVFIGNNYTPQVAASAPFNALQFKQNDVRDLTDGVIFTAAMGAPTQLLGDVYIDYEVELCNPIGNYPVSSGNASCAASATKIFQASSDYVNPQSQLNFAFSSSAVGFTTVGQVLVTIMCPYAMTNVPVITVSSNATVIAGPYLNQGSTGTTIVLTLNCNGYTVLNDSGTMTSGAGGYTRIIVAPLNAVALTTLSCP